MIVIYAECLVKAQMTDTFVGLAKQLIEESRKEQGNVSYELIHSREGKNIYAFLEKWQDQNILDAHLNSRHFQDVFSRFSQKAQGFRCKMKHQGETRWNKTNRNFWMAWCISSARSAAEPLCRTGRAGTGNSAPTHAAGNGGITTRCRSIGNLRARQYARSAGRNFSPAGNTAN